MKRERERESWLQHGPLTPARLYANKEAIRREPAERAGQVEVLSRLDGPRRMKPEIKKLLRGSRSCWWCARVTPARFTWLDTNNGVLARRKKERTKTNWSDETTWLVIGRYSYGQDSRRRTFSLLVLSFFFPRHFLLLFTGSHERGRVLKLPAAGRVGAIEIG